MQRVIQPVGCVHMVNGNGPERGAVALPRVCGRLIAALCGVLCILLAVLMTACSSAPGNISSGAATNDVAATLQETPTLPKATPFKEDSEPATPAPPTTVPKVATRVAEIALDEEAAVTETVTMEPAATAPVTVAEPTATAPATAPILTATATLPAPTPEPTAPPTATATATAIATATAPTAPAGNAPTGAEILFLREGALMAHDVGSGREREIASSVTEFAATPDGSLLALVRGSGRSGELWVVDRDGTNLRQLTSNTRAEGGLAWSADGLALAYTSSDSNQQRPLEWLDWAAWCSASDVRVIAVDGGPEQPLEPGCDPAISPDGLRVAFATPPQAVETMGESAGITNVNNTIRLVNRKGENGWSFAKAQNDADSGRLVYAPAWSPDGGNLAYHRFVGYQALVDINYVEMGGSYQGQGNLLTVGAGWLLPPRFSPDGVHMAVVEHDPQNARGVRGYEMWRAEVVRLGVAGEVFLPEGSRATQAESVARLPRVAGAAWSPDGESLAVLLPANWSADVSPDEPAYEDSAAGALWRWTPGGGAPTERLTGGVDYASPVLWLP